MFKLSFYGNARGWINGTHYKKAGVKQPYLNVIMTYLKLYLDFSLKLCLSHHHTVYSKRYTLWRDCKFHMMWQVDNLHVYSGYVFVELKRSNRYSYRSVFASCVTSLT